MAAVIVDDNNRPEVNNWQSINLLVGWWLPFAGGLILILYFWARLSYKFYKYELTDLGFKKESGVIQ